MDLEIISNLLWLALVSLIAMNRVLRLIKKRVKVKDNERRNKTSGGSDSKSP